MKKKIDYIATILLVILGFVHTVLTPVVNETFDLNAVWFTGTGLGFLFLGFMNLARLKTLVLFVKRLCLTGNILGVMYSILVSIMLAEPQAYLGLVVLLVLSGLSLADSRSARSISC